MHVADDRAGRSAAPRLVVQGHQAGEIEPVIRHRDLAILPPPGGAGAVGIDLDAVALGVRQIHGLADEVIGRAVDLQPEPGRVPEPASEVGPGGQQERGMKQPGCPGVDRLEVRAVQQVQQLAAAGAEPDRAGSRLDRLQADCCRDRSRARRSRSRTVRVTALMSRRLDMRTHMTVRANIGNAGFLPMFDTVSIEKWTASPN